MSDSFRIRAAAKTYVNSVVNFEDIAAVEGVRGNQLVGYGLVVGLDGTGEQTAVTAQSLTALLQSLGVTINRPPRDGRMAFVRSPDNISIELLQAGGALAPAEPWLSMGNTGHW